ncbi:MAG TPA: hypothetical protein VN043_01670 [Rhodanobacter sp.]|nr:hypothetical protein [Rhodanobacter sp.]
MLNKLSCRAAFAGLLMFGLATPLMAASMPSTGLGQAWPNTVDASSSPSWHAYVFMLGGVKYVQINDANGNVVGAVGTVNGQFITLPIGRFSQLVSTPQDPVNIRKLTTAASVASPTTVYQDGTILIKAATLSNGMVQLTASTCDPIECNSHVNASGAATQSTTDPCDPIECNSHVKATAAAVQSKTETCDPIECNSHVNATAASTQSTTETCDPIECNSHVNVTAAATQSTTDPCDPIECNSHIKVSGATTQSTTGTCDPVECNSHLKVSGATTQSTTETCDPIECNSHVQ